MTHTFQMAQSMDEKLGRFQFGVWVNKNFAILLAEIKKITANQNQMKKMSEAAQRFARIDSAEVVAKEILKLVADSKAESIIGGGDTALLINKMKMEKDFSFVSTGGGATLDFLANGTLPGIKALE